MAKYREYDRSSPWIRRIFTGKNAFFFLLMAVAFVALNIYRLNDPLQPANKIENFKLTSIDNQSFMVADIKIPVVLVFYKKHEFFSNFVFNNHYRRLLPQLKFIQDNNYAQVVVVAEGYDSVEKLSELASDKNHTVLKHIGYVTDTAKLSKMFGIRSWPHLFVIGSDGTVLYEAKLVGADYIRNILWRD